MRSNTCVLFTMTIPRLATRSMPCPSTALCVIWWTCIVSENDDRSIRRSFSLDSIQQASRCCNCRAVGATLMCDRCSDMLYCVPCFGRVHSPPVMRDHRAVTIGTGPVTKEACRDHPRMRVRYWCETCSMSICTDCISARHKDHAFDLLAVAAVKRKGRVSSRCVTPSIERCCSRPA